MARKLPEFFDITIDDITSSGEGIGFFDNRPIYVYGVLPGERVKLRPLRVSRYRTKAGLVKILDPSSLRLEPRDDHFLSCSPWQIIPLDKQHEYKKKIAREMFLKEARKLPHDKPDITTDSRPWNYRNKMELTFTLDDNDKLQAAFYGRGRYNQLHASQKCEIAHECINETAQHIVCALRDNKILYKQLKTLIIRYSYAQNKCVAMLQVVDKNFPIFEAYVPKLAGWQIIYSDPLSPASVATEVLHKSGTDFLIEDINGLMLQYFCDGFFQVNPKAFNSVITYLKEKIPSGIILVDLYAGVGTIGLALAEKFKEVYSIEMDSRSSKAAEENAASNNIKNISFFSAIAEKKDLRPMLSVADTLIVDPPRSGLHPKVIKAIMKRPPKWFAYVSCNTLTQARDFAILKNAYKTQHWQLFDLHPQTPHIESILIMERK